MLSDISHLSGATIQFESGRIEVDEGAGSFNVCVVVSGTDDCAVQ